MTDLKMKTASLGLLAVLLLAACAPAATEERPAPTEDPAAAGSESGEEEASMTSERSFAGTVAAPEFPPGLDWLNTEQPLTLAQLRGKVVLLDFWTYGCINCIHIIPDLERLEAEYPNELVVIGVHSAKFTNEGDTDNIRQIILRYGLEHPVVNDSDFIIWRIWGARAWPTLALIDPAGKVVGGHSGEGVYPLLQPVIDSLVREFDAKGLLDRTPLEFKLENEGLPETVLSFPGKVLADGDGGRLFISDTNHNRIVIAEIGTGEVLNVIGTGERAFLDGDFRTAGFAQPQGLALAESGDILYIADTENHAVRAVDLRAERVTTVAGTGLQTLQYPPRGGVAPSVALNSPWDLALDGENLYIAMAGSHQVWLLDLATQEIGPFAGNARESTKNGPLAEAELAQPSGLALDGDGRLYFADSESSSIRWAETDRENGVVDVLVGSDVNLFDFGDVDGVGTTARLQHPLGVAWEGGMLYVADTYNSKIKRVDPETRFLETFLGGEHGWRDGIEPLFYEPGGIDAADGKLYIADTNNHAIRVVDLTSNETSTLVLKGIERFTASADDVYEGALLRLDPVEVAAGPGVVRLEIELPPGYKINDLAPSSLTWQTEGGILELPPDADWSLAGPSFPRDLSVEFKEGEGELIGDLNLIYCEAEKESLCLIEQVRLEAAIKVAGAGADLITFSHRVELPELLP